MASTVLAALLELRGQPDDISRYLQLRDLQSQQPDLFYRLLVEHTEEVLPLVYTPTVGDACLRFHALPLTPRGLYLRATDAGAMLALLRAQPQQDVRIVVATDGERILGLGDLGANGMGIAEGKSLLYTAAAGVPPHQVLPICLDVGTSNKSLLADGRYAGLRQPRLKGEAFDRFFAELVEAVRAWRPHVVLHLEDFANHTAFELLRRYQYRLPCFNDDIQGTACIALAGLLCALRVTGSTLAEQRVLFLGAGEAGTGIGEIIAIALQRWHGLAREQGRARCFFLDSKGLVTASRTDLQPHKRPFAHALPPCRTLAEAVAALRPTALIGVSTQAGAFTPQILQAMAELNERPIIFPLSNPTSKSECTFREALDATGGRAVFASGSPFHPESYGGKQRSPSQANNAYVFPALGWAASLCGASCIRNEAFLVAAEALSHMTSPEELAAGQLFPRFSAIRSVSARLVAAVAEHMCGTGVGAPPADFDEVARRAGLHAGASNRARWEAYARAHAYNPAAARL